MISVFHSAKNFLGEIKNDVSDSKSSWQSIKILFYGYRFTSFQTSYTVHFGILEIILVKKNAAVKYNLQNK